MVTDKVKLRSSFSKDFPKLTVGVDSLSETTDKEVDKL